MRALSSTQLDLRDITLVCQDWGGLIGLRLVAEHPDRFAARGRGEHVPAHRRRHARRGVPRVAEVLAGGARDSRSARSSTAAAPPTSPPRSIAAYDAPFPDESYKDGRAPVPDARARRRPTTRRRAANRAAWEVLAAFEKPFLCAFSDRDPITAGAERTCSSASPAPQGQPHTTIEGGGHFLQEDKPPELAKVIIDFIAAG